MPPPETPAPPTRRPIAARDSRWAATIAAALARVPIKPNTISIFSAVFAAAAGACFAATACPRAATSALAIAALFIIGAACVQLRLLCNLFDGMVAVEGGFKTKSGEIFNELPDRFADAFILIGLGCAATPHAEPGYIAAVLAVITAYVRALGASAVAGQNFMGPMAKQHRMAVVTIAAIACAAAAIFRSPHAPKPIAALALLIMIAGMLITIARRTLRVIRTLENKGGGK